MIEMYIGRRVFWKVGRNLCPAVIIGHSYYACGTPGLIWGYWINGILPDGTVVMRKLVKKDYITKKGA